MDHIILCNIGNRDVYQGDSPLTQPFEAREGGQIALSNIDQIHQELSLPLIEPTLPLIFSKQNDFTPIRVILFATDQTNEKYRKGDTLYHAEIIKILLNKRFSQNINDVEIKLVQSINPILYDEVFDYFSTSLQSLVKPEQSASLLLTGGIPAFNSGLLIQGIRYWGANANFYYKPEGKPTPIQLYIGDLFQERALIDRISLFQFGAAISALEQWSPKENKALIYDLLRYAEARYNFNLKEATQHLFQASSKLRHGATYNLLEEAHSQLKSLDQNSKQALIGELFYNARIAWENRRYVDFLTRAIRFKEEVLVYLSEGSSTRMYLLETLAKPQSIPYSGESWPPDRIKLVRQIMQDGYSLFELQQICFDLGFDHENYGSKKNAFIHEFIQAVNRRGMAPQMIQALKKVNKKDELWNQLEDHGFTGGSIFQMLSRLEGLTTLYESSILGFGVSGVSGKTISDSYPDEFDPIQDMAAVCSALKIHIANPFRIVRSILLEHLSPGIDL